MVMVFSDPPVRNGDSFHYIVVLSIQVLPNVHLNFNSSQLAGPTTLFRLLFACFWRDLPSDIRECVGTLPSLRLYSVLSLCL